MEVSRLDHAPAALTRSKNSRYSLDKSPESPTADLDTVAKRKISSLVEYLMPGVQP
jgi:hypothetical protein